MRAEILSVATRLFAERGYDGTSLADIAREVGLRKPSLLYHFASKDELRREVLAGVLSRWNEVLPNLIVAATQGEDQFDGITRELVSFFFADPNRARLLIREALDRPDDMRARFLEHVRPVVDNLAKLIRKGQETGTLQPDVDPEAYLIQTITLLISGVVVADGLGGMLPKQSSRGQPSERLIREELRMAKSSLFARPPATTSP